ncbi:TetR/AcrR family transcriptional regulator [Rhodococcus sp. NPDC058639]|uniref:TetR/AcrR family transcriptional regulator n=1 Tax=Rhodococcus sp. NPDC058639 TaxID=3346570 RepID=UPI00364CD2BA
MPILNAGHTVAEHKSATRTRILSAFAEVLAREGWDGASVKAVASQAGLTRTVIYNYYADKSEMLLAWSAHEIERFLDLLTRKLAGMDDPRDMLETVVELVLLEFAGPHPVTPPVMSLIPNATKLEFTSQLNELEDVVYRILVEGEKSGVFRLIDARSASRCILGCLDPHRQVLADGGPVDEVISMVVPFVMGAVGALDRDPHAEPGCAATCDAGEENLSSDS